MEKYTGYQQSPDAGTLGNVRKGVDHAKTMGKVIAGVVFAGVVLAEMSRPARPRKMTRAEKQAATAEEAAGRRSHGKSSDALDTGGKETKVEKGVLETGFSDRKGRAPRPGMRKIG